MFIRRWLTRSIAAFGLLAALSTGFQVQSGQALADNATGAATGFTIPGTWASSVTVLNPSTNASAASVEVDFYDESGNKAATVQSASLAPGATAFWYVPNIAGLPAGHNYSAVVTSDQQVYATVNLSSSNPSAAETYDGVADSSNSGSSTSAIVSGPIQYIPSVNREYYGSSSTIVVQNTSTSATPITINLVGSSSLGAVNTCVTSPSLQSMSAWTLDLESMGSNGLPSIGTNFNGAATVYGGQTSTCGQPPGSSQPIAVISNQYRPDKTPPQFGSTNAFAAGKGASQAFIPGLYNNYYGASSSLIVQNADSTSANITVTYTGPRGTATDVAYNLAPGASKLFYTPNAGKNGGTGSLPSGWQGSASVVSSSGQVILTQVNISASNGVASYDGFPQGTTNLFAPGLNKNYYGANSSLTIQNVDTMSATVRVTYSNSCTDTVTLSPGQSQLIYIPTSPCLTSAGSFNGGASVTSDGAKIVGLIATSGSGTGSYDGLYDTNAFGSN